MFKRLAGLVLLMCFVLAGSIMATAQCGSSIKIVTQNCGPRCGAVGKETCEGVGTRCEDGTGEPGVGCCGLQLTLPGSCQTAKAVPSKELLPSEEFLAFREALALRKMAFQSSQIMIASCAPDRNAFNEWLQAKLKQQQQR